MKIILKRLELLNFKGIRSLAVDFNEHTQNISGANETGKTTVFNAFLWLNFGKDMEGRKDYEIKTTDLNGEVLHKLDHQVTGIYLIDGVETTARRLYKEKWVKARGAAVPELEGHRTEFFWNDVPCQEKDYQEKVNGIVKEDVFKLLTNPLYFNTGLTGYKIPDWQARRNVLLELAGKIDDNEIASGDTRFEKLLASLKGKTLEDYRKQLAALKKNLKEQLEAIPTRIDEATRAIPDALDFEEIGRQILAKEKEIADLDRSLTDAAEAQKVKNNQQLGKQNEIFAHKTRLQIIEADIRSLFNQEKNDRDASIREHRASGRSKETELSNLNADKKRMEDQRGRLIAQMEQLKADWHATNNKQPEPQKDDLKCPACGQDQPADKIDQKNTTYKKYAEDFNANKVKRLGEITKSGQELKAQVEGLDKSLEGNKITILTLTEEATELRKRIEEIEADSLQKSREADQTIADRLSADEESKTIRAKIEDIQAEILALQSDAPDNSGFRVQRQTLVLALDGFKKQRDTKERIEQGQNRVMQLQKEEVDLSQQLVKVEGIEYIIQEFTRAKIDLLESRINQKFKHARFKLFDRQVNGQEVECCETTYKGVVFGSLNTAGKVLVGIDIINALSDHYGISAPIFLDNRESVTSIPDTEAQTINLIVSPVDKQLRVA